VSTLSNPRHRAFQWARPRRRLVILTAVLVVCVAGDVYLAGMYPLPLIRAAVGCASTSSRDVSHHLGCLVKGSVGQNASVRGVELAVAKGDGSFSWAGAAGIADPHGRTALTGNTPIYIASVTKIYIAALVMRLSEDKLLSLDAPAAKYLPPRLLAGIDTYRGHDYSRAVTIRELLSMTSGLPDYYAETGKDGKTGFDLFLEHPAKKWTPEQDISRTRTELKPHFAPGTGLYYSDTNYQLLGKVIESVTHTSLAKALQHYELGPLGLRHTWLIGSREPRGLAPPAHVFDHNRDITTVRSSKDYWADGGLVSTPRDMIAFLRALNNGKLISRASLREMQTWHNRDGSPDPPIPGTQYGYSLWHLQMTGPLSVLNPFTPTWGASGSTGSFLYYSKPRDLYLAGTVNSTSSLPTSYILMGAALTLFKSK
jgi:D-alanyl-D-alanine carboxypeptidase